MITIEEFLRAANQMRDYYAKKIKDSFEEYRFSPNEISILIVLKNNKTITTSTELKVVLGVSKALISRSVDSLEKKGLIQVYKDVQDSRVSHLKLTTQSQPVLEKVDEEIGKLNEQLCLDISEEEMRIFIQTLNKMRERFKEF